jgi:3-oxoacyl-[acyl-carrier-protein] synthase II
MDASAIWITGLGAVTPLGNTYAEIADNLLQGRSGVLRVEHFDTTQHACRIAAQCPPLKTPVGFDAASFNSFRPWEQALAWCASSALCEAGLWDCRRELRLGLVIGLGAEWQHVWERDQQMGGRMIQSGDATHESVADQTCRILDLMGPAATVAAACASGNIAIAQARRWLKLGWVDVCLAGGLDLPVTPVSVACFGNLGALTKRNDEPTTASRPFDRDRDGFVLGEGGVLFAMERADFARKRGATPHAEVAGFGASSDAAHLVIPSSDPGPATQAIRAALRSARVDVGDVDYINAHGTSTPVGDKFETQVLHAVFENRIQAIPVSATKSMTGHMLSAAAAFETLACIVAMKHRAIPPTINLDHPDPECNLCHVANQAREQTVNVAVNNAFGFGGSNTCLVLKRAA